MLRAITHFQGTHKTPSSPAHTLFSKFFIVNIKHICFQYNTNAYAPHFTTNPFCAKISQININSLIIPYAPPWTMEINNINHYVIPHIPGPPQRFIALKSKHYAITLPYILRTLHSESFTMKHNNISHSPAHPVLCKHSNDLWYMIWKFVKVFMHNDLCISPPSPPLPHICKGPTIASVLSSLGREVP